MIDLQDNANRTALGWVIARAPGDLEGALALTSDQRSPNDIALFINGLAILVFSMASAIAPNDPTGYMRRVALAMEALS
jgi:hypothetical protein